MEPTLLLDRLAVAEKLKCSPRHAWTSSGRRESVAEHSWRLALMALLVRDEFPELNMERVIHMCLIHDLGEAFTGDIPAFVKTASDAGTEDALLAQWLKDFPPPYGTELPALLAEMLALETEEARLYKALDRLEAIIQHNESPLSTWLPLEYQLQFTYGVQDTSHFPYLQALRAEVDRQTSAKIDAPPGDMVLQTDRLYLRPMNQGDFDGLCAILQDPAVMYAYEHAFSDEEVQQWLDRQLSRYQEWGFGLWAVKEKATGLLIGQCGLTMQDCGGGQVLEIGYLFRRDRWHQGFATEAAVACREYAFSKSLAAEVYSIIRNDNYPSQNVAIRSGMTIRGMLVKHYHGIDMPHLVFSVRKDKAKGAL